MRVTPFFISVVLHGAIFLLIHWASKNQLTREPVQIEIAHSNRTQSTLKRQSNSFKNKLHKNVRPRANHLISKNMRKLISPYNYMNPWAQGTSESFREDNPLSEWGDGGRDFFRIQDFQSSNEVFEKINNLLFYPIVLGRNAFEGIISARVVLNDRGQCIERYTTVQSPNKYLKAYIGAVLKKFCKSPGLKSIKLKAINNFDFSFQFSLTSSGLEDYKNEQKILGNVLFFKRTFPKALTEWHLGPFTGIFPIPSIYLDIPWIVENYEKLFENKDPLAEYRK